MALYYSLAGRLETFAPPTPPKSARKRERAVSVPRLPWPHAETHTANPRSLAQAGFWHSPSEEDQDNVACFMCDKQLSDWESGDDPRAIHVQKSPHCPWVVAFCKLYDDKDKRGNFQFKDPARHPQHPDLYAARLETFGKGKQRWWPHDMVKGHGANSKAVAKAGFCFTPANNPEDDTATCFYCGTILSNWDSNDDPVEEHRRRNPTCAFLQTFETTVPPNVAEFGVIAGKPSTTRSKKGKQKADPSDIELAQPPPATEQPAKKGKRKTIAPEPPAEIPVDDEEPIADKKLKRTKSKKALKTAQAPTDDEDHLPAEPAPPKAKAPGARKTTKSIAPPPQTESEAEEPAPPSRSTRARKPTKKVLESEEDVAVILAPKTPKASRSKSRATRQESVVAPSAEPSEEDGPIVEPPKPSRGRKGRAKEVKEEYEDTQVVIPAEDEEVTTKRPARGRKTVTNGSSRSRSRSKSVGRGKKGKGAVIEPEPEPEVEPEAEPEAEPAPPPKLRRGTKTKAQASQPATDAEETDAVATKTAKTRKTTAPKGSQKKKQKSPDEEELAATTQDEEAYVDAREESPVAIVEVPVVPPAKKKPTKQRAQPAQIPAVVQASKKAFIVKSSQPPSSEDGPSDDMVEDHSTTQVEYMEDVVDVHLDSRGSPSLSDYDATPKAPRQIKAKKSRSVSRGRDEDQVVKLVPEVVLPLRQEKVSVKELTRLKTLDPDITMEEPIIEPAAPFTGGLDAFEALFPGIQLRLPLTNGRQIEIPDLTEAEKDLSVEEWIRLEIDRQYETLKRDGEARIAMFKKAGEDARRKIEKL